MLLRSLKIERRYEEGGGVTNVNATASQSDQSPRLGASDDIKKLVKHIELYSYEGGRGEGGSAL